MLKMNQPEERVRPVLLRMLDVEPDHVQARLQLLSYAARRNDTEEVVSICSTAIDYSPEVLEFYYYKGIGLYQQGKHGVKAGAGFYDYSGDKADKSMKKRDAMYLAMAKANPTGIEVE